MHRLTEESLRTAFVSESQAFLSYQAFADRAEREGHGNVARLFRAAAESERIHAVNHLLALKSVSATATNLDSAIVGEGFQFEEMYPAYMDIARNQREEAALESMQRAMMAERVHEILFGRAKAAVVDGRDFSLTVIWVCPICGFCMEGDPPDTCPVCATDRASFQQF
jgi:rubrerythrin